METSSLAFTGPKVLVTPRISRTTGACAWAPAVPPPASLSVTPGPLLHLVWDLDVAVYDPLLRLVHFVLDVLRDVSVEAAERLQADLLALRGVVEGVGRRTRVLHQDLAVRAHRLDAGLVAGLELADQVGLLPAQETDDLVVGVGVLGALLG